MTRTIYFITHPNVVVDRAVPVPHWKLSEVGKQRVIAGLSQPWIGDLTSLYCSTERKAIEGAAIIAEHIKINFQEIETLGENDRSATGFLEPAQFELVADAFFASPNESIRGWERAIDAQSRVTRAVTDLVQRDTTSGPIGIVSHGAVGTLLYCWLAKLPISREWDQPPNGGGNYFSFSLAPQNVFGHWRRFDPLAAASDA